MNKKKKEVSIIRSSAAEYLTFITATGESDVNKNAVIRKFRITEEDEIYKSDFDCILIDENIMDEELTELEKVVN